MSTTYTVQRGDTLSKIARRAYGDAALATKLAEYNGLRSPDWIRVNQVLTLPSLRILTGKKPDSTAAFPPPNGLTEILKVYGDIYRYLGPDGLPTVKWETDHFGFAKLPFPIPLSWDLSKKVTKIYCHKKLVNIFEEVFGMIQSDGLAKHIRTFGGCYAFRRKRGGTALSTHSWGIAIDLNPETNALGSKGDMHSSIVDVFTECNFTWGGEWAGDNKDPMHFQYCSGY